MSNKKYMDLDDPRRSNESVYNNHIKNYVSDTKDMKVGRFYYDPKQDNLNAGAPGHGEFFFVDENDEVIGHWFMSHGYRVSKGGFYSIGNSSSYATSDKEYEKTVTAGIKYFYETRYLNTDNLFHESSEPEVLTTFNVNSGSKSDNEVHGDD